MYRKLHEFNLYIEHGIAALREMAVVKGIEAGEVQRIADYLEEIRADASEYLSSAFSSQEERAAGRLFRKRRRREMAEDPMHPGWLEEERGKDAGKALGGQEGGKRQARRR